MARSISLAQSAQSLTHRPGANALLGCAGCRDLAECGGLNIATEMWSCQSMCCNNPSTCNAVCPKDAAAFVARAREVGGWKFESLPRLGPTANPDVPDRVHMIYHGSSRTEPAPIDFVAVPLRTLMAAGPASLRVRTKDALAQLLAIRPSAGLIVDCIGFDAMLERYWAKARATGFVNDLRALGPLWVVGPNFSLFNDVPRWDNLHNMKRIAIAWHEFSAAGIPAALHVNARTERDWERWGEFVRARPEVQAVSFEFGTGGRIAERRAWQVEQLATLGRDAGRELRLFVRGSVSAAIQLRVHFRSVTLIETKGFIKTIKRQRLVARTPAQAVYRRSVTLADQPLDELLAWNLA